MLLKHIIYTKSRAYFEKDLHRVYINYDLYNESVYESEYSSVKFDDRGSEISFFLGRYTYLLFRG